MQISKTIHTIDPSSYIAPTVTNSSSN